MKKKANGDLQTAYNSLAFQFMQRLEIDGRFFRRGNERLFLRCVSYGPFPPNFSINHEKEFQRIHHVGFHAIRIYEYPTKKFLDLAAKQNLHVWVTLPWGWGGNFKEEGFRFSQAIVRIQRFLKDHGKHPALAGMLVANEIPADIVRLLRPVWVKSKLEELITFARSCSPKLLFAYANYPTTEYLEPSNADFTCFNVYLENKEDFKDYLARLQHIASDRPLFISEFGLDSLRAGEQKQAEIISWAQELAATEGCSGFTLFSWSDAWQNGNREMTDWAFGLTKRDGTAKTALETIEHFNYQPHSIAYTFFSIIVCTYNGASHLHACLRSLELLDYPTYEIIVVDDGSVDNSAAIIQQYEKARYIHQANQGLSVARNTGAAHAQGEVLVYTDDDCSADQQWLHWLNQAYQDSNIDACGGPNIPPEAETLCEAIVAASPGGPSHVLKTDKEAEHIPGCNLSVRKKAFNRIDGFDPQFNIAGDDVDFCWRLEDAGYKIGFSPCAFVWHKRRANPKTFWKQQWQYGKAEAMLYKKHPQRFTEKGSIRWGGAVYEGAPISIKNGESITYSELGENLYQAAIRSTQALRPLQSAYNNWIGTNLLKVSYFIQPIARWLGRTENGLQNRLHWITPEPASMSDDSGYLTISIEQREITRRDSIDHLLSKGWGITKSSKWDLQKNNYRILLAMEQNDSPNSKILIKFEPAGVEARSEIENDLQSL